MRGAYSLPGGCDLLTTVGTDQRYLPFFVLGEEMQLHLCPLGLFAFGAEEMGVKRAMFKHLFALTDRCRDAFVLGCGQGKRLHSG
jgi:hypothetical protein